MSLDNNEFYVIVGLYPNGKIGEIFIYASKTGSSMRGFAEGFAIMASRDLQNSGGDSIEWLIDTFKDSEFAPSGWTGYTPIPMAKSFLDLIVRWLEMRFL
jgi:ribonucleoside-diphosphate reductase alpha chain